MSEQQFDIVFRGDIVFGHQLTDVKQRLQQLFKTDSAKVDALFSGRPIPLKRGLDQASAQKYKHALLQAGAQVDIVASSDAKSSLAPVVAEASARASAQAAPAVTLTNPPDAQPVWSVAAVGSDLLAPAERTYSEPMTIDISALSVRPEGGNILDASEQPPVVIASVMAPQFGVAEAGADLLRADEKISLPLPEITLEDWGLAALGADLIAATEKPQVAIPVIHVPEVSLAPAGADLGQLKPQVKAVIPDVSGIRLAD